MPNGIRLGKLFGIEIRLDFSWFLIFALATWLLADNFSAGQPEWQPLLVWSYAIVTSLLFFASVLIHELAHSLVSKAQGIPVPRITLFIFGGAAQISAEPRRARDEFLMALAGPLTSLLLAAGFGASWFALRETASAPAQMMEWLATVNLMLGVFNLLPGLPLDGGRVLRAILWGLTHNLRRATTIVVACGRGIGWLIMFAGLWQLLNADWVNGIWFLLIGWFLENAARREGEAMRVNAALRGHTAREALMTDWLPVSSLLPLDRLVETFAIPKGRSWFPVMEQEHLIGLVTLPRVLRISRDKWAVTRVGDVMTPFAELATATPDDELTPILEKMARTEQHQIPILDASSEKFLGVVSRQNIQTFFCARDESNGKG